MRSASSTGLRSDPPHGHRRNSTSIAGSYLPAALVFVGPDVGNTRRRTRRTRRQRRRASGDGLSRAVPRRPAEPAGPRSRREGHDILVCEVVLPLVDSEYRPTSRVILTVARSEESAASAVSAVASSSLSAGSSLASVPGVPRRGGLRRNRCRTVASGRVVSGCVTVCWRTVGRP